MPAGTKTTLAQNGRGIVYETTRGQARLMDRDPAGRYPKGYMRAQVLEPGSAKLRPHLAADGRQPQTGHLKGKAAKQAAQTLTHHDARAVRAAQPAWDAVRGGRPAVVPGRTGNLATGVAKLAGNSGMRTLGRTAGRAAAPLAVVIGALDIGSAYRSEGKVGRQTERAIGRTAGGLGGAAAGAAIGSMILPGVGTVVGGVIGGVVGSGAGDRMANAAADGARSLAKAGTAAVGALADATRGVGKLFRNPFG